MVQNKFPFEYKPNEYSIKDLEYLSGIKAHTIRIWEQRYKLLSPKRSKTNIRFYTDDDLIFIMNVGLLNQNGLKISHIANLPKKELEDKIADLEQKNYDVTPIITDLVKATIELNEADFVNIIENYTAKFDFEKSMTDLIYPFIKKVGGMWLSGSLYPAQEHFVSNLIRQKLIVEIDNIKVSKDTDKPYVVLFTPEHEYHEIPILFSYYLLKKHHFKVFYLGTNVPLNDLYIIYQKYQPKYFFSNLITHPDLKLLPSYLKQIAENFKNANFFLSGLQVMQLEDNPYPNITIIRQFTDYINLLKKL